MATHSSILAWEMPWTEEPGRLQSMGSQRVRGDLVTKQQQGCLLNDSKKEAHKLLYQKLVLFKKKYILIIMSIQLASSVTRFVHWEPLFWETFHRIHQMVKKEINGTKSKEQEMKLKLSSKVTKIKSSPQGKQLSVAWGTLLRKCPTSIPGVARHLTRGARGV